MDSILKIKLSGSFLLVALIPALSKFDVLAGNVYFIYLFIFAYLILLFSFVISSSPTKYVVVVSAGLLIAIEASFQAPLFEGALFVWDQHISTRFLTTIVSEGTLRETKPNVWLRGSDAVSLYPLFFSFLASVTVVTGAEPLFIFKVLPVLLLPVFPTIGYSIPTRSKGFVTILWIAPVFNTFTSATTDEQMFSLLLLGVLLIAARRFRFKPYKIVLVILIVAFPLSHSFTPFIGVVALGAYFFGTAISNNRNWFTPVLLGSSLFGIWFAMNNIFFFAVLGEFISGGLGSVLAFFQDPAPDAEYLEFSLQKPASFWIGLFVRFFGLVFFGLLVVTDQDWSRPFEVVKRPAILMFGVGAVSAVGLSLVFGVVDLNRVWLVIILLTSFLIDRFGDDKDNSEYNPVSVMGLVCVALSGTILLFTGYRLMSDATVVTSTQLTLSTAIVGFLLLMVISIIVFHKSEDGHVSRLAPKFTSRNLVVLSVGALLVGHLLVGFPLAPFSSTERESNLQERGVDYYHEPWDYTTAKFASTHAQSEVVGDFRARIVESYYRHPVEDAVECYFRSCRYAVIIWYDNYPNVWQAIRQPAYTSVPGGEERLSTNRSKIYTTEHSDIFINTSANSTG